MIVDHLENAGAYASLDAGIASALSWLQKTDLDHLDAGLHSVDGDRLVASIEIYESKPLSEGKWEAHRKCIDLQYIVHGEERLGYAPLSTLDIIQEYDDVGDYLLATGDGDFISMSAGMFMVLAPQDAHMPRIAITKPASVHKVVMKVRMPT